MPHNAPVRLEARRLLVAVSAGLGVVLSAPFMGEIRRWIRLAFPDLFVLIVGGAVGLAAAVAVGVMFVRVRERRLLRYGLVTLAFVVAVAYARQSALGSPDSDVVERVHFVEYGLITWLFYRAWWPLGGMPAFLATFFSALTIGTFEEWFQWFIPARVGEVRDVLLNSAAIGCGMLFSAAIQPPSGTRRRGQSSWSYVFLTCAVAIAALAGFVDSAHLGHEIRDPGAGIFKSIYSDDQLRAIAEQRTREWKSQPPLTRPPRVATEDQYASEGLLHVQARNNAWAAGEVMTAWGENLILETYFAPVLDTPSYVSVTGHRWSADHRADAERRASTGSAGTAAFYSRAEGAFPIYLWPRSVFRAVAASLLALLAIGALVSGQKK